LSHEEFVADENRRENEEKPREPFELEPESYKTIAERAAEEKPSWAERYLKTSMFKGWWQKFQSLPTWKKALVMLLLILIPMAVYGAGTIVSNVLSGTVEITGLSVSIVSPPLLPDHAVVETDYVNSIAVSNPMGAGYPAVFVINFTSSKPGLEAGDFEVYIDKSLDHSFTADEKLTCTLINSTTVKCTSGSVSIPTGTNNYDIKIRFKSGLPVPTTITWKLYLEAG